MNQRWNNESTALVFNIQKCSIHDGPGIRTIVFLKGCPLRCPWCANPESQSYLREIADTQSHCISCGICIEKCPKHCIFLDENGHGVIDREICNRCGICTEVCYAKSKRFIGEKMTVKEIIQKVERDKTYYTNSKGGVTFSGGEPLTHPKFLLQAARECKKHGISVAVETCGFADYQLFEPVLEYIDLFFIDIKEIDSKQHKVLTGHGNEKIIENIRKIDAFGSRIIVRMPVIPGYNDRIENFKGIAELAASIQHAEGVELLAYHALGAHKYEMLGRKYALKAVKTPKNEKMLEYVDQMNTILMPAGKRCWFEQNK
ncbi:MAG: Benzylsuccinate synthase activating enzyme [Eubacterium sp.]|uniref:glycyl-radical enzyme activating protein n=1 Tax=Eubacterium sp. TaxID=142586 RepID=UPI00303DD731